jgi:hypothetical protein
MPWWPAASKNTAQSCGPEVLIPEHDPRQACDRKEYDEGNQQNAKQ